MQVDNIIGEKLFPPICKLSCRSKDQPGSDKSLLVRHGDNHASTSILWIPNKSICIVQAS